MNKRQQLGARSRTAILDAALQLMSESGYDGASVSKIAHASGLPASSIYWHFGSKSGILAAVMERGAEAFFSTAGEVTEPLNPDNSSLDVLRTRFQQARRSAEDHPEFLRLLFLLILADPGDEAIVSILKRVNDRGLDLLHAQISEAFASRGDAEARSVADRLTVTALMVFNGAFLTVETNPEVSLTDLIDDMAEIVVLLAQTA
jgi:AcrR family transcriptional regulator